VPGRGPHGPPPLTAYLFVSTIGVLARVQLDELLGTSTGRRARSLIELARTAIER